MHRIKYLLQAYLAVIAVLVAAAAVALVTAPPVEREHGAFYQAYWNPPETFDPVRCYETRGSEFIGMCLEGLYEYGGFDRPLELVPALAAAMPEVSEDGRTYLLRLRPDIRSPDVEPWQGTPRHVRAEDIAFSFKRMADHHVASRHFDHMMRGRVVGADDFHAYTRGVEAEDVDYDRPIEGIEVLDDLTLRIRLEKPYPQFVYKLAKTAIAPMPREWFEHVTRGNTKTDRLRWRILGTGPYMLEDYQRERHCIFVRNPMYRGRPDIDGHPSGLGGPHPDLARHEVLPLSVDRMVFRFNREQLPRWFNFTLGLYDKSRVPRDAFGSAIGPSGDVSPELAQRGVIMDLQPQPTIRFIGFAMDVEWIRENVALRRAMSFALNRERHVEVFQNGDGIVSRGLIPPVVAEKDPDHVPPYERHDPEAARALVEEARAFHEQRYGEPLPTIVYTTGSTSALAREDAEDCRLAWERVGLDVETEFVPWGKFLTDLRNRQFTCWRLGWVGDYPDPENFLALFHSPNRSPGPNSTCYANAEYDRLYERAAALPDSPERDRLYDEMLAILERDVPVINIRYDVIRDLGYDWIGQRDPDTGTFRPRLRDHVWLKAKWAYMLVDVELREARLNRGLEGTFDELVAAGRWIPIGDPRR